MFSTTSFILTSSFPTQVLPAVRLTAIFLAFVKQISFLFVNLTGIFPLLGILGTVISLLGMVGDMTNVQDNFYGALTSTFWGLVFAIIFKFLDGIISAKIEDNEKNVQLYLERNNAEHSQSGEQP